MNSTEVQNPRLKLGDKCLCLSYVFGSVLACQSLLTCFRSFLTHFADFSLITLPQTLRLFYTNVLSSTEKPQYRMLKSLDHTLPLRTCYGEIYGNIAREEMADLVAVT